MFRQASNMCHYLTYNTIIDELRLTGLSIRAARKVAEDVRNGMVAEIEPSYMSGSRMVRYSSADRLYVASY